MIDIAEGPGRDLKNICQKIMTDRNTGRGGSNLHRKCGVCQGA